MLLSFSYKLVAQYSVSSVEDSSFYANAIFNGQSLETKTPNDNEKFLFVRNQNQPRRTRNKTKTSSSHEYQCNEKYPCTKEVWHITEVVCMILGLPTRVWKHTMDYNNNVLYFWLGKIGALAKSI